jgi:hypothetical protein
LYGFDPFGDNQVTVDFESDSEDQDFCYADTSERSSNKAKYVVSSALKTRLITEVARDPNYKLSLSDQTPIASTRLKRRRGRTPTLPNIACRQQQDQCQNTPSTLRSLEKTPVIEQIKNAEWRLGTQISHFVPP